MEPTKQRTEILKVASETPVVKLAGAIAEVLRRDDKVTAEAIGAGAVNAAVKACAVARGYLAPAGWDVAMQPHFFEHEDGERTITGIRMEIFKRGER